MAATQHNKKVFGVIDKQKKDDEEIKANNKKEKELDEQVISRFGRSLLELMGCHVIYYNPPPNTIESKLDSIIHPPERYVPNKDEQFLLSLASGPTPSQIYRSILTETRTCLPYATPKEIYFRHEQRVFLNYFEAALRSSYIKVCRKKLKKYRWKIKIEKEQLLKDFKNKYTKRNIRRKIRRIYELFGLLYERKCLEISRDLEMEREVIKRERMEYVKKYEKFADLMENFRRNENIYQNEINFQSQLEKIGKDTFNMVKIKNLEFEKWIRRMTGKLLSGIPAIQHFGYNELFSTEKWWETVDEREKQVMGDVKDELNELELKIEAINSVLVEKKSKYEAYCLFVRELLQEFHIIISFVIKQYPQFTQYLPIFEKFFKMRMSWYLKNVKEKLGENAHLFKKMDPRHIKTDINHDENYLDYELQQKRIKKRIQPLSVTFQNMNEADGGDSKKLDLAVGTHKYMNEFNTYVDEIITAMKKSPHVWKLYIGHI